MTSAVAAPSAGTTATATAEMPAYAPPAAPPPPYAPPFAPHGPFARRTAPLPPPPPTARARAPKPPKQRSVLGRITFSLICLALATLGAVDLLGNSVPGTVYFAAALGVTGLGLVIGTWFGRARGLIALGILLALVTSAVGAGSRISGDEGWNKPVIWAPASATELQGTYQAPRGDATLDLRKIDFTDRHDGILVKLGAGTLRVLLPPNVDVTVDSHVGVGNSRILGEDADGLGLSRSVIDGGADGTGGGTLGLNLDLGAGTLEVTR
jgi:hypothetical protein